MSNPARLPALETLKSQANRLRRSLVSEGSFISHSEALELIARQYGCRDWNTLSAAARRRPTEPLTLGSRIAGEYLGQPFTARIIGLALLNRGTHYRISLDLDEAVDVVTFDSFSAFRKRINATVDRDGVSAAATSNGRPHLALSL